MKNVTFDLTGKVALVIGGTTGIGHAIAMEYARWGANVIAVSRRANKCKEVADEIRAEGVQTLEFPVDAQDREQLVQLRDKVVETFGRIDILVNAAGVNRRYNAEDFPMEEYDAVMNTNCRSLFMSTQVIGQQMIKQGYGKIINIASMGAYLGLNRVVPYCGSKGAVLQMTKGFAVEWAKYNVQVNAIAPGYFKTELTSGLHEDPEREQAVLNRNPMKRWGNVEELTGASIFLATDASSFVTGTCIPVDGGMLAMGV